MLSIAALRNSVRKMHPASCICGVTVPLASISASVSTARRCWTGLPVSGSASRIGSEKLPCCSRHFDGRRQIVVLRLRCLCLPLTAHGGSSNCVGPSAGLPRWSRPGAASRQRSRPLAGRRRRGDASRSYVRRRVPSSRQRRKCTNAVCHGGKEVDACARRSRNGRGRRWPRPSGDEAI